MSSRNNYSLVLSPEAVDDRKDIVAYTITTWGKEQATRYNQKLKAALKSIHTNPHIGRLHPDLPPLYHIYHVERHYIVYSIEGTRIEVVRILHDRMDLPRHIS